MEFKLLCLNVKINCNEQLSKIVFSLQCDICTNKGRQELKFNNCYTDWCWSLANIYASLLHWFVFIILKDLINLFQAHGKYRQKGRDYIVEDGDIILFKFNAGAGLKDKKKWFKTIVYKNKIILPKYILLLVSTVMAR